MRGFVLAIALITTGLNISFACDEDGKTGIVEQNDLWISADDKGISTITEKQFNDIITRVEEIYEPVVKERGATLKIEKNWSDGTVNAYAQQTGNIWKVAMFGGLARHKTIIPDAFALVLCHELGHHLGGAPKKGGWFGSKWASNEGQSDYFGTMKCLRKVFEKDDNQEIMKDASVDLHAAKVCRETFNNDEAVAVCQRGAMAGLSLGNLFRALRNSKDVLKFTTPSTKIVSKTDDSHPAAQCRLDTYFAGAICKRDAYSDVSDTDPNLNVCNRVDSDEDGIRPLCWFKPPRS